MDDMGYKVIVSGHVQGVGFRYFTFREAQKLNLTGHAKNLANGDVEVLLFGGADEIEKMLKWLREGPQTARVDDLLISQIDYAAQDSFRCL